MKNLKIKQKQPQEAKRPALSTDIEFNLFFNYQDIEKYPTLKNNLIKKLKYKIFIVPVDSKEKTAFINSSTLLSQIDKAEVKTSIEAKGAEYKQVVLYGFGEYFLNYFETLENEQDFKKGYFFNKLYVAITRAQSELIIIDSKESQKLFWKKLIDNVSITNTKWKILEEKKYNTIQYNAGSVNSILEGTSDNALDNAKEDKKLGEYDSNPARLKVASNQFFKLGFEQEAYECLAIAEDIKYNHKAAGEYYIKAENIEKASMSFFYGRYFNEVEKIGTNIHTIEQDIRIVISKIMNNIIIIQKDIDILNKNKNILYIIIKDLSWRDEIVDALFNLYDNLKKIEDKKDFVDILSYILKDSDIDYKERIGTIYYSLNDYNNAIKHWDKVDNINTEEYVLSKIRISDDAEDKTIWKSELLYYIDNKKQLLDICREIINVYLADERNEYTKEYIKAVYKTFIYLNDDKNIKIIGKQLEVQLEDELQNLEEFYHNMLNNKNLNKNLFSYIVERWAKVKFKINNNLNDYEYINEINKIYIQIAKEKNLSYKKFTFKELENISNYPKSVHLKPSEHLVNIKINNFRCFDSIELNNIGQFNLILGDNNIGKTSLLEALLFTNDYDQYIKNMLFAYATRVNNFDILNENNKQTNQMILDIINQNNEVSEFGFVITENRNEWKINFKIPTENELKDKYGNIDNIYLNNYICKSNNKYNCDIKLLKSVFKDIKPIDLITTQFIPYGKGFDKDLVNAYAKYIDRDREKRDNFLKSMKVFIPNIDRINVDTQDSKIYIEEIGDTQGKPLHYYGEGSKKLFRILVQIILQKDKKLLIDEIDAGIHYSHFKEFWKVVLKVAKLQNVQIFATTHNIECIKHFQEILKENEFEAYQDSSRTITLKQLQNNSIKAYIREYDEFEYELENELDIRGGTL
jgi:AAA15 family ATPase/GTPase